MEREVSVHPPCLPGPLGTPKLTLSLQSHIRTQSSEELTEILHVTKMGGSMAGFLRLAARSPQSVIFPRAQPSAAEVLYFALVSGLDPQEPERTTVVTGGPDWRCVLMPARRGGPGPGRPVPGHGCTLS